VIQEEEYSDDQEFEEEPVHSAKNRPVVALAEVQSVLADFTVYLQAKHIPHSHILRYLMPHQRTIKVSELKESIIDKFPFAQQQAHLLARYLVEPRSDSRLPDTDFEAQRHEVCIQHLIQPYHLFNGIAVTSLLTRLHEIV